MLLLQSSFVSNASFGANPRLDMEKSSDSMERCRLALVKMAFPYMDVEDNASEPENYDVYFDELDAIEAARKAEESNPDRLP